MHTSLRILLAQHGGLVVRSQLLDIGLSPSRITQLCREGALIVVRRGVYADAELWESLDAYRGRPRLRARAALMKLQRGWVMSHDSAALKLGMPLLRPQDSLAHITRPGFSAAWTRYGVKHHYARFRPSQLIDIDGRRVLDAARTAVDLAREHGEQEGVVACDWALRNGTTRAALLEGLVPMASWPYVVRARSAVEHADPRAENANETLGRLLIKETSGSEMSTSSSPSRSRVVSRGVTFAWATTSSRSTGASSTSRPSRAGSPTRTCPRSSGMSESARGWSAQRGSACRASSGRTTGAGARDEAKARLRAEYAIPPRSASDLELSPRLAASAERLRAIYGMRDRARGA